MGAPQEGGNSHARPRGFGLQDGPVGRPIFIRDSGCTMILDGMAVHAAPRGVCSDGVGFENPVAQKLPPPRKIQSLNPATGDLLAEFDSAEPEEVQSAVAEARRAAPAWRRLGSAGRARYLV